MLSSFICTDVQRIHAFDSAYRGFRDRDWQLFLFAGPVAAPSPHCDRATDPRWRVSSAAAGGMAC